MTRISKDPEERRLEIIKAAEKLFNEKGFSNTAVSDIVKSIGVAQGTFYYYFKSKDDVFNAIVEEFLEESMAGIAEIARDEKLGTREKIELALEKGLELIENNEGVLSYLHTKDNMDLHEKVEKKFVEYASPLVVNVVKQGIQEKLFDLEYPDEVVEFLMTGSHYLGDVNIYLEDKEEYLKRVRGVQFVIQRVLGVDSNIMECLTSKFISKLTSLLN
ncbi:TetR/AcrR family transcriptional regulator [Lutispora saccharofermentans]|uniref:TetR/AcrR family transcriptional regulator n=1 Tax=Lutispora saccharofermentans TaxID=3024236 RepID=A0ABT1NCP4_9FIRM|nr:TetR/AcrR family transcriptional regulator [Lutispora saccharofermentans]MCQ1529033.1 TetR/AcrR family transcriptional regulator [Lutispora saccharofermentans]